MIGTAEALVKWLFNQNREKLFEVKEHWEWLKAIAQKAWQDHYNKTKDDFIRRYGRNYL